MRERFSKRHGYSGPQKEIKIREDAPEELRITIINLARDLGLNPSIIREVVCNVLLKVPNLDNWSEYPNIWNEANELIQNALWYKVYDIAEEIVLAFGSPNRREYIGTEKQVQFQESLNDIFYELGIGWKMENGKIQIRGSDAFESTLKKASDALKDKGRTTAQSELVEAIRDLSKRPEPDITGAIQHSMASLECVARDVCGNPKATLGDIIKRDDLEIPPPLDEAVKKAWGYASEMGRHIREGRQPEFPEAELIVGICASISTYLCKKY